MRRVLSWAASLLTLASRPAFVAGVVVLVLLFFGLIPLRWWWLASLLLLSPVAAVVFLIFVGALYRESDG